MAIIKSKNYFLILFLAFLVSIMQLYNSVVHAASLSGLELPLKSNGDLIFYADIYQFEKSNDTNRIEICYSLDLSQIETVKDPIGVYSLMLKLELNDRSGRPVGSIIDKKRIPFNGSANEENGSFIDLQKFDLAPDTLNLILSITDSISGKMGSIQQDFEVKSFPDNLSLSDPVFIAYLQKSAAENTIFTRHHFDMVPNPARLFDVSTDQALMYVYFDINHLEYEPEKPSFYRLECSIDDLSGNNMTKVEYELIQKVGVNTSRIEKFKLDSLGSGIYALTIKIADLGNDHTAAVKRYFRAVSDKNNPALVMPMAEEDIKKYMDQIKYIATDRELKIYEHLDPIGKQEFLLQFWKSKDPTPGTRENEFMENHFQKLAYCEKHFQNGINCDQGRIYIQYGPPIEIERTTSTQGYSRPVEIWTYGIEGRVEFIFVDRANDGNYLLMHSTHPREYSNPDWVNELQ
jgi:GWxTD domain-containing protein